MINSGLWYGPRVILNGFVPEGELYIMNDGARDIEYPDNYDDMTVEEKLKFAIDNDLLLIMNTNILDHVTVCKA